MPRQNGHAIISAPSATLGEVECSQLKVLIPKGATMQIRQVTVEVLETPVELQYVAAGSSVSSNWHVLSRISTDDGIQGLTVESWISRRPTGGSLAQAPFF